jgi:hypothetical protein
MPVCCVTDSIPLLWERPTCGAKREAEHSQAPRQCQEAPQASSARARLRHPCTMPRLSLYLQREAAPLRERGPESSTRADGAVGRGEGAAQEPRPELHQQELDKLVRQYRRR